MLVESPLKLNEEEVRKFSEKYIMSLEYEYLFNAESLRCSSQKARIKSIEDRIFSEADLLEKYSNPEVLDVGSSRICSVGTISPFPGHKISLRACDALAPAYNVQNKLYGLKPYVEVEFAFVERLTEKYPPDSFDIVRMRNALDHCYDPFIGVFEMLRVVKKGGTVRLIHAENEAEREMHYGMHQWNITSKGADSMLIWREGFSADLRDILGGAVSIHTEAKTNDKGIKMIHTDIVKLDDIEISVKTGMNILDDTMITFCMMKNCGRFESAYRKVFHRSPFSKSIFRKMIDSSPIRMRKHIPQWIKRPVKTILNRIGH